ncbi:MAG TPA: hypothetical protein VHW23_41495 [Kofleriaceae bacterium]|jgi:hypothetical protein|nr:hypothetical protein [Kofleriaceae bacterium]
MRVLLSRPRGCAAAIAVALAALSQRAAAQRWDVEADGAVNVGYNQQTQTVFVPDPGAPLPSDTPSSTTQSLFMEIRPGILVQTGSPRLTWRAGYIFAGTLSIVGDQLSAASNQVTGSVTAEVSKFSFLTLSGVFSQGGTAFQLTSRSADSGVAELRAPGSPDTLAATAAESMITELARKLTMQQTLVVSASAPEDDLSARNSAIAASLALDRVLDRDSIGVDVHGSVSWLVPLQLGMTEYKSYTSSVGGHWNHDFSLNWNGMASAGVEQVFTDTGSKPLAFLPTGGLALRYTPQPDVGGALDFTHGTATNLQVGSVSLTDRVGVHGAIGIDSRKSRAVAFSASFLHNEPLGQVSALVAAGTGNAVQLDAGFTTALAKNVLGNIRYSFAYQFGQGGGLPDSLAHIFYIGVTGVLRNTDRPLLPLPLRGQRVDGGDSNFPVVEEAPEPSPDSSRTGDTPKP